MVHKLNHKFKPIQLTKLNLKNRFNLFWTLYYFLLQMFYQNLILRKLEIYKQNKYININNAHINHIGVVVNW